MRVLKLGHPAAVCMYVVRWCGRERVHRSHDWDDGTEFWRVHCRGERIELDEVG